MMPSVTCVRSASANACRMSVMSSAICSTTFGRRTFTATTGPWAVAAPSPLPPAAGRSSCAPAATGSPRPCASRARCTCATEAEPKGFSSMSANVSRHGCPSDSSIVCTTTSNGTGATLARSVLNASAYALGMTSLRFEAICPIFTNVGPKSSRMAVAFSGVRPENAWCSRRIFSISCMRWPDVLSLMVISAARSTSRNVGMLLLLVTATVPS